ncbi:MAG: ABC transporter permease [Gammaproteobacteria bacterium]
MNARLWTRLKRDRAGMTGLAIIVLFLGASLLSWAGILGSGWSTAAGGAWEGMSAQHWFGTNRLGQDIFDRAVRSIGTAFRVGLVVALCSVALGAAFGAAAGWRPGSWLDEAVLWIKGVLDSVPFYLFAAALAFALGGLAGAMYLAMIATFWTATGRLVRGEIIRLRQQEFVQSARAIGLPPALILWRHLLPNTVHILTVQGALTFVAAIKTEVILSFLGLGVQDGVSWGLMLAESTQDVLAGHFGNFLSASLLLFGLLLGFNLLADALQDAVDVREVGA